MASTKPRRLSREERNRVCRETRKRIRHLTRAQLEDLRESLNIDLVGAEDEEEHVVQMKLGMVLGRLYPLGVIEWAEVRRHPIPGETPLAASYLEHMKSIGGKL